MINFNDPKAEKILDMLLKDTSLELRQLQDKETGVERYTLVDMNSNQEVDRELQELIFEAYMLMYKIDNLEEIIKTGKSNIKKIRKQQEH